MPPAVALRVTSRHVRRGEEGGRRRTRRISSSVMQPGTSLLFLNTSREAPVRRWG